MNMYVSMQQQNSNKVPWSFAPPQVAYRGSCGYWSTEDSSQCRLPYNARGTPFVASDATTAANSVSDTVGADSTEDTTSRIVLEIAGSNFGHQNPGDVRVVIGSRECTNAKWIKVHPDTGTPYITCYPDEDVLVFMQDPFIWEVRMHLSILIVKHLWLPVNLPFHLKKMEAWSLSMDKVVNCVARARPGLFVGFCPKMIQ
jgi:hypothetical protein